MAGHQLDDREFVTRLDPKGMLRLTEEFPAQCRRALEISRGVRLSEFEAAPDLVFLTGLGGSAAGGDFARALFEQEAGVPFIVNRDYHMPPWVSVRSLVFCASYSGNTEETLSAFQDARRSGAQVVSVTSGGKLAELTQSAERRFPVIQIPGGQPPRTALGYMLIPVLDACVRLEVLRSQDFERAFKLLDDCVGAWGVDQPFEQNDAKQLAAALHGRLPLLYGLGSWQATVANRWKGQINENAKNLCYANAFPELNHNEILGWVKAEEQGVAGYSVVLLEDGQESAKMQARARVTLDLIGEKAQVHRVKARGETLLERVLSLTFMGDFVSLYLAALNGVDPENIDWINVLKSELAKVD